ncbi:MAG TPA: hypothetical protein VF085_08760 [Solirubrobacterales bacterium]
MSAGGGARATMFGLDVWTEETLPFLRGANAAATGRRLDVSLRDGGIEALEWPETAELISDERLPGGEVNFRIEADAEAGYLIWGPHYGASLLSADAQFLRGALGRGGIDSWQRLLIAQALPFAAVLRGLEVLHASAVVAEPGAVAFLGPSGAGKTSLALALCRRGASFLADDVLAIEAGREFLVGHPGAAIAGVDHLEADSLIGSGQLSQESVLAVNSRERVVRIPEAAAPAALAALFFVDRRADGPARPRFEPAADAQMLLAATFNLVLAAPQRLRTLLDVCAQACLGRVERVVVGPGVDATELGAAVEARLRGAA